MCRTFGAHIQACPLTPASRPRLPELRAFGAVEPHGDRIEYTY